MQNMIVNHKMVILRNNHIPKGLVPLEKSFDKGNIIVNLYVHPHIEEV